jgi:hypothetical protein
MDQVSSLLNRPKGYYNVDGVGELGIGFMCLGFAFMSWMQLRAPEYSLWNKPYTVMVFVLAMSTVIKYGSEAIKKRITYPRTGFVEYRKRDTVWIPMIVGAVVAVAIAALLAVARRAHWELVAPGSLIGLLFAACYAYGVARTVQWKWIVAIAMTIASVWIALLPPERIVAVIAHSWIARLLPPKVVGAYLMNMTLYGVLLLLSGGLSFVLYLRRTQVPGEEA